MAEKLISLLDITKRNGTDQAIGLVEEITTWAPELQTFLGRPIPGTTFRSKVRTALPAGPVFRKANDGTDAVASTYEQKLQQCYILDGILKVDEQVANAPEEGGRELILADESSGLIQQKAIGLGAQIWYGTANDASGFAGLQSLYDSAMYVKAGGTSSSVQTSAYIVWQSMQGVHLVFGGNQGLTLAPWARYLTKGANSKDLFVYATNLSGWIGLAMTHTKSVVRIANIEDATGKSLTDAVISQAVELLPEGIRQGALARGELKLYMNRKSRGMLQRSRTVTMFASGTTKPGSGLGSIAPLPTESNDVPIIVTDSINSTEAVVS